MAESSGRKRPKIKMPGLSIPQKCMGGLFHFLDIHQHPHIPKMLTYNKKSKEKTKSPKEEQAALTHIRRKSVDYDEMPANVWEEDARVRNNTDKAFPGNLNPNRRHGEKDLNQNLSIDSPRLLQRTVSIHHMESNDYINNVPRGNVVQSVNGNSQNCSSSINREQESLPETNEPHRILNSDDHKGQTKLYRVPDHLLEKHSLLREKLNNAKEMSKKEHTEAKEPGQDAPAEQSKELVEMMMLLNNNRELLLKILKDPSAFGHFLEGQQNSSAEKTLERRGSFPGLGLSSEQDNEISRSKHKPRRSEVPVHRKEDPRAGTSSAKQSIDVEARFGSSSRKLRGQRTAQAHFKNIKKKIKEVIKENKTKGLRITMDGVLDKVPYGKKLSHDAKKERKGLLERPASTKYDRDNASRCITRTQSLSESLDKYSQLLGTISSSESKKAPEKPKLEHADSRGLQAAKPPRKFERIFSLPDFDITSSWNDVQYGTLDVVRSFRRPMTVDISGSGEHETVDSSVHSKKSLETDALVRGAIKKDANAEVFAGKDQQMLLEEQQVFESSRDLRAQDSIRIPLHEEDPTNWLTKTCEVTDLDLYFPESLASTPEFAVSHPLGQKPSPKEVDQSDVDASDQLESAIADFERSRLPDELDDYYSFFSVPVDLQNEAQFSYVRDTLWKSGFGSKEFLRAWYSPNQPIDPLLFEESEWISDPEIAQHGPEVFLENQNLFDLVNEVLLEIYDTSASSSPWLSRYATRMRPLPEGPHVLEEVWAKIGWYLDSQVQVDSLLDDVVARDFSKDDGWMDVQYDCEDVGVDVADLILMDLVDEAVLPLENLSHDWL